MKNKKNFVKLWLFSFVAWAFGISLSSAVSLKLDFWESGYKSNFLYTSHISPIHFADNGNDFWGFFYFSNENYTDESDFMEIDNANWEVKECQLRVKWFYYDSQRWERLWPLDESTKDAFSMSDLEMTGGLYTTCFKEWYNDIAEICKWDTNPDKCIEEKKKEYVDDLWYYGYISHEYKGQTFGLMAWVRYLTGDDWIGVKENSELSPTFQRHWTIPVWFVYDYNGWVGFVWCEVKSNNQDTLNWLVENTSNWEWIAEFFDLIDSEQKPYLELKDPLHKNNLDCKNVWTVENSLIWLLIEWLVGMSKWTNSSFEWSFSTDKMQLFSSASVNNAKLINYARKNAESLCRWKWKTSQKDIWTDSVVCLNINNATIDASDPKYKWKTLIVKWWANVSVKPNYWPSYRYDIFVDWWNLLIYENWATSYLIDRSWFPSQMSDIQSFNDSVATQWSNYNWEKVSVASVLEGNFVINWHILWYPSTETLSKKYFIYWKLSSLDTVDDLEKVFTWRCNGSMWTDWNYCPHIWNYWQAWLTVIDQDYDSPLLK